jgi:hypothetical protein
LNSNNDPVREWTHEQKTTTVGLVGEASARSLLPSLDSENARQSSFTGAAALLLIVGVIGWLIWHR